MKKLFVLSFILILGAHLHGLLFFNDLVCAFNEGAEKMQIENRVVEGSVHFFMSKSHADLLLKEYEQSAMTELDKAQALAHVENAIVELQTSIGKYQTAADIGKRIGTMQFKIQWFKGFDYGAFATDHKLNPIIANDVSGYLSKGDIVGLYQKNLARLDEIATTLIQIKTTLKNGEKPGVGVLWTLVQQYSETLLFGNYATMMGRSVLGNCDND